MSLEDLLYPPHDYSKKQEIVDAIGQCSQNVNGIDSEDHAKELSSISKDLSSYSSEMSSFVQDVLENDYHTACTIYFSNPEEYSFPFRDWESAKGLTHHDCSEFLNQCPKSTLLFDTYSIIKCCKDEVLYNLFTHHLQKQYHHFYKEDTHPLLISLLFMYSGDNYNFLSKTNEESGLITTHDISEFLNNVAVNINRVKEHTNYQTKEPYFKLTDLKPLAFLTHLCLTDEKYRPFAFPILNQVDKEFIPAIFNYMNQEHSLNFYSYTQGQKYKRFGRPSHIKTELLSSLINILPEDENKYFSHLAHLVINDCDERITKKDFYSNANVSAISNTLNEFKINIEKHSLEQAILPSSNLDLIQDKKKVKI